jgi:hypothetical protein
MRYRIEKGVVLFIPADLAKQEYGVEHEPRDYQREKDDAQHHQHNLAQVQQYPADVQSCGEDDKADTQYEKEYGGFAASHVLLKCKTENGKLKIRRSISRFPF